MSVAELLPWLNVLVIPFGLAWVKHVIAVERRLTRIETLLMRGGGYNALEVRGGELNG